MFKRISVLFKTDKAELLGITLFPVVIILMMVAIPIQGMIKYV